MKLPGRRWQRAAVAAALAAASAAFAAGTFAGDGSPSVAGSATPSRGSAVPSSPATPEQRPALAQTARSTADPVTVVAAGDIACDPADGSFNGGSGVGDECRAKAVARVIAKADPQALLTLGDHQYDDGRYPKFKRSYHLSYGIFKAITYPAVGNHEYYSSHRARGFFDYFGAQAGTVGEGWYSFDLGAWHMVALNSNCEMVGCDRGSPQYEWLEADLEKDQSACTLAFWHSPRFSSGPHGPDVTVAPFWR